MEPYRNGLATESDPALPSIDRWPQLVHQSRRSRHSTRNVPLSLSKPEGKMRLRILRHLSTSPHKPLARKKALKVCSLDHRPARYATGVLHCMMQTGIPCLVGCAIFQLVYRLLFQPGTNRACEILNAAAWRPNWSLQPPNGKATVATIERAAFDSRQWRHERVHEHREDRPSILYAKRS